MVMVVDATHPTYGTCLLPDYEQHNLSMVSMQLVNVLELILIQFGCYARFGQVKLQLFKEIIGNFLIYIDRLTIWSHIQVWIKPWSLCNILHGLKHK